MTLVDENPCGESERTISAGPKKGENPDCVGFGLARPQEKTRSAPSVLLFSLYCCIV